jgi:hypothetical protein
MIGIWKEEFQEGFGKVFFKVLGLSCAGICCVSKWCNNMSTDIVGYDRLLVV